jgi:hypothetical protein
LPPSPRVTATWVSGAAQSIWKTVLARPGDDLENGQMLTNAVEALSGLTIQA